MVKEKEAEGCQGTSFNRNILEQGFTQLQAEGKVQLRDYLQNLVSIQNAIAGATPMKDSCILSKDEQGAF